VDSSLHTWGEGTKRGEFRAPGIRPGPLNLDEDGRFIKIFQEGAKEKDRPRNRVKEFGKEYDDEVKVGKEIRGGRKSGAHREKEEHLVKKGGQRDVFKVCSRGGRITKPLEMPPD